MNVISFLNKYKYIIILLILIIYLILVWRKTEGFDNSFVQYRGLPNKYVFDSVKGRYNNIFGFHKGGGFHKKAISEKNDLDKKISILNKLLDKLLNKFLSDDQDCVGDFTKYSDCDKDCGDGKQTRKFSILKKKGKRGEDCKYEDGYTETIDCYGGICQNDERCEKNADCIGGNCNPKTGKCEKWKPCSADRLYMCDEYSCKDLNDENLNDAYVANGSYLWNNTDDACFFKTPAEMKQIEKNIYEYSYDDPTSTKYEGECIYYQVNDGHGKCSFRKNIELGEDENPVCKKGWGPEPTTMNIKDACSCCAGADQCDAEKSCECKKNKYWSNENGHWECADIDLTKKCAEGTVRKTKQDSNTKDGGCDYCNWWEKYQPGTANGSPGKCVPLDTDTETNSLTESAAKYLSSGKHDPNSNFSAVHEICEYDASGVFHDSNINHPIINPYLKSNPPNLVTICDKECAGPTMDVESGGGLAHLQKQLCNTCNKGILSKGKCVGTADTGKCASGSYSQNNYYCCGHEDMVIDKKIWTGNVNADSEKACKCPSDSYDCLKTMAPEMPLLETTEKYPVSSCKDLGPHIGVTDTEITGFFKKFYGYIPNDTVIKSETAVGSWSHDAISCDMFYEYAKEADISVGFPNIKYSAAPSGQHNLVKRCIPDGTACKPSSQDASTVSLIPGSNLPPPVSGPDARKNVIDTAIETYKVSPGVANYCKFNHNDNYQGFQVDIDCSDVTAGPAWVRRSAEFKPANRCNNTFSLKSKSMCKWEGNSGSSHNEGTCGADQADQKCVGLAWVSATAGPATEEPKFQIGYVTDPCKGSYLSPCQGWDGGGVDWELKMPSDGSSPAPW